MWSYTAPSVRGLPVDLTMHGVRVTGLRGERLQSMFRCAGNQISRLGQWARAYRRSFCMIRRYSFFLSRCVTTAILLAIATVLHAQTSPQTPDIPAKYEVLAAS